MTPINEITTPILHEWIEFTRQHSNSALSAFCHDCNYSPSNVTSWLKTNGYTVGTWKVAMLDHIAATTTPEPERPVTVPSLARREHVRGHGSLAGWDWARRYAGESVVRIVERGNGAE